MHKQVSGCTVNFGPNFPESPFLELKTRKPPLPHFGKLQIWDDQSLLQNTLPHFGKLQIWDDQSLLQNTPPHFGKLHIWDDQSFTLGIPPLFGKLQIWDDQSLLRNSPPPKSLRMPRVTTCGDFIQPRITTRFGYINANIFDDVIL